MQLLPMMFCSRASFISKETCKAGRRVTRHSVAGNAPNGNQSLMLSRNASQSTVGYCTLPPWLADCSARSPRCRRGRTACGVPCKACGHVCAETEVLMQKRVLLPGVGLAGASL